MKVSVGVEALNWSGRSIRRDVLPLRESIKASCTSEYTDEFKFVDFVVHLGDRPSKMRPVAIHRRASSIQCDIYLDIPLDASDAQVCNSLSEELRAGGNEVNSFMQSSTHNFDGTAFVAELENAIRAFESASKGRC